MKTCPKCTASLDDAVRFCPACGTDVRTSDRRDPLIGRVIANNFRVVEPLGSGAMGTIYKAEQLSLGKTIVIKVLHRHLLGDPTLSKRFHREARAASLLNHPNCIQVIDFGQTEDQMLYIAMEHIDGVDLADLLYQEYPLDPRRIIHIVKQICMALDEAHANGVLHRDLKPENIMVEDRRNVKDFVKVLDFGIAKLQDNSPGAGGANTFQTVAGVVCGTPEYMSPEQARGEKLDGRSDLYSVGILLYQLLTNQLPFEADSALGVVTKHLTEQPRPPRQLNPGVLPALEALCLSLCAKNRDMRPPAALDVIAELDRIDREIEAQRRQALLNATDSDRTVVELKPIQLQELESARAAYDQRVAAAGGPAVDSMRDTVPGTAASREYSNQLKAGLPHTPTAVNAAARVGRGEAVASVEDGDQSNVRLWLITALVATAVALGGWLVYRVIGG